MTDNLKTLLTEVADGAKHHDLTELAIQGARRRHTARVVAPLAAIVAVALVALAIWLPSHSTNKSVPPAHKQTIGTRTGLDVSVSHTVYTADGHRLAIPADLGYVHATHDGNLVLLDLSGDLWIMQRSGSARRVATNITDAAVDATGTWIGYTDRKTLHAGRISGTRLVDTHGTAVEKKDQPLPVAVLGNGTVVLTHWANTIGVFQDYDVWDPAAGAYHRSTTHHWLEDLLGVDPDGKTLIARTGADVGTPVEPLCLDRLDPAHDFARTGDCTPTTDRYGGIVSPTGMVLSADATGFTAYRPNGSGYTRLGRWTLAPKRWKPNLSTGYQDASWADGHTALIMYIAESGAMRLARLDTDHPGRSTQLPIGKGIIVLGRPATH